MREDREFPSHVGCGGDGIRAVAEDGEDEGGGQAMAQEGGDAHPRRGESLDGHEGRLSLG